MVETTDIDQAWFVVSPQNPFKKRKTLLHEFDRLDMVNSAIHDNFNLRTTDVEFNMPKPSYTIDTLVYLTEKHPNYSFRLIIGEDNLKSFPKWKNYNHILDQYGLYVYPRPNAKPSEILEHPNVKLVDAPMMDISATFIRSCVKNEQSIKYLVPDSVEEMIRVKKFYL